MDTEKQNGLVPAETVLRYVKRELKRAYVKIMHQSLTITRLQKNIKMLLEDPELKKAVAREAAIKEYKKELAVVGKRLHEARVDRDEILEKYAKLQLRLLEQEVLT